MSTHTIFRSKPVLAAVLVALAFVPFAAQAKTAKSAAKAAPEAAVAPANVVLAHQLGADKGEQLARLIERFNAQSKVGQITLADAPWQPGDKAQLAILNEGEEAGLISSHRYTPLWQVMKEAREPLKTLPVPRFMVPSALDASGHPIALPVGLATPLVFVNKDVLSKTGVNADTLPRTWGAWQDVLSKLVQSGQACPMTASYPVSTLLENASAWNNQAFATGGKNEQIAVNGLIQVKHLAKMSTWYRSGLLKMYGRGGEGEEHFAKGECAVLVAPSSAYPTLKRAASFPIGVAAYPYHDDAYGAPQNTWADGPAMWVGSGLNKSESRVVAAFVAFWLEPQNQVDWQVNAGYLPLSQAGYVLTQSSRLMKEDLEAQRIAIAELTNKPVTNASAASALTHRPGVNNVLADEMEQVLNGKKPPKQGLDDAVERIRTGRVN